MIVEPTRERTSPTAAKVQRMKPLLILALALATTLHAQDSAPALAPELAPLAAKYKTDTAALNAQKDEAIIRVAQTYRAALDAAESVETTAGHLKAIAAITAERGDLKKDEVKSEFPDDLPKGLQTARKNYLSGVARIVADIGQRQQRFNADYLRDLHTLQTRIGGNRVLAAQIADEKQSILNIADDEQKKALLTSCWWQIRDVVLEFTPGGSVIRHGDPHGWDGKSWKLSPDGRSVECTYANGQMQSYSFKNGGLVHFDPSWGEFKKVHKK